MTETSLRVTLAVGTCIGCGRIVDVRVTEDGTAIVVAHDGACDGVGRPPRGRLG